MIRFASICSGIEAASVAFGPLGFEAAWFSEIEKFPCALLAHHFPQIPNHGDMNSLKDRILSGEIESPELVVGGPPCQAFSLAGLRGSLGDSRGQLTLTYCEIADAIDSARSLRGERPAVIFYENVPGILSDKSNAFGCFLAALSGEDCPLIPPGGRWTHAGYVHGPKRTIAWRTLDAQYCRLAQRRKRVFVVASARDGFDPAAVLFESEGVRRDSPPSREARKESSTVTEACIGGGGVREFNGSIDQPFRVANCLTQRMHKGINSNIAEGQTPILCFSDVAVDTFLVHPDDSAVPTVDASYGRLQGASCQDANHGHSHLLAFSDAGDARPVAYRVHGEYCTAMTCNGNANVADAVDSTRCIDSNGGYSANQGGNIILQPVAFSCKDHAADAGNVSPTLRSMTHSNSQANGGGQVAVAYAIQAPALRENPDSGPDGIGVQSDHAYTLEARSEVQAVAFQTSQSGVRVADIHATLDSNNGSRRHNGALIGMQVRRLTPTECERLQGFPDGWTQIPWRGKAAENCPDGPRYKAIGNSWAVTVVRWIGQRIKEELLRNSQGR
jgi:DNA (cytosine-5)-methyltransferase 1